MSVKITIISFSFVYKWNPYGDIWCTSAVQWRRRKSIHDCCLFSTYDVKLGVTIDDGKSVYSMTLDLMQLEDKCGSTYVRTSCQIVIVFSSLGLQLVLSKYHLVLKIETKISLRVKRIAWSLSEMSSTLSFSWRSSHSHTGSIRKSHTSNVDSISFVKRRGRGSWVSVKCWGRWKDIDGRGGIESLTALI